MDYEVSLGEQIVGTATVKIEGLYYHITCICCFSDSKFYRLFFTGDKGVIDLGLCPSGRIIEKRLPIRSVGDRGLQFSVNEMGQDIKLYPLDEVTSGFDIKKLPQARLRQKMGVLYLMVKVDLDEG